MISFHLSHVNLHCIFPSKYLVICELLTWTTAAVRPNFEINARYFFTITAQVTTWEVRLQENIFLYLANIISIVTYDSCQVCLFYLNKLCRFKHSGILVPKSIFKNWYYFANAEIGLCNIRRIVSQVETFFFEDFLDNV